MPVAGSRSREASRSTNRDYRCCCCCCRGTWRWSARSRCPSQSRSSRAPRRSWLCNRNPAHRSPGPRLPSRSCSASRCCPRSWTNSPKSCSRTSSPTSCRRRNCWRSRRVGSYRWGTGRTRWCLRCCRRRRAPRAGRRRARSGQSRERAWAWSFVDDEVCRWRYWTTTEQNPPMHGSLGSQQACPGPQASSATGAPSGLSAASVKALLAGGSAGSMRFLYPYAQTVFPRGLIAPRR
jgi:hypothetical protein